MQLFWLVQLPLAACRLVHSVTTVVLVTRSYYKLHRITLEFNAVTAYKRHLYPAKIALNNILSSWLSSNQLKIHKIDHMTLMCLSCTNFLVLVLHVINITVDHDS